MDEYPIFLTEVEIKYLHELLAAYHLSLAIAPASEEDPKDIDVFIRVRERVSAVRAQFESA